MLCNEGMAGILLRRIADGKVHQSEDLAEAIARDTNPVRRDPAARARGGPAADAMCEISRALESLAQAGLVSHPRRGTVKITTMGLEEVGGDPGRPEMPDSSAQSRARAGGADRPAGADKPEAGPLASPPLSPEEIANIKAIASGAAKLRHVSKAELFRIVSGDAGPRAHAGRPVP